jgi:hypothetical protein
MEDGGNDSIQSTPEPENSESGETGQECGPAVAFAKADG